MKPEFEVLDRRDCPSTLPPVYNGNVTLSNALMMTDDGHIVYLTDDGIQGHLAVVQAHRVGTDPYNSPTVVDVEKQLAIGVDPGSASMIFNQGPNGILVNGLLNIDGATLTIKWSQVSQWYAAYTSGFNADIVGAVGGQPAGPTFQPVAQPLISPGVAVDPEIAAALVSLAQHNQP